MLQVLIYSSVKYAILPLPPILQAAWHFSHIPGIGDRRGSPTMDPTWIITVEIQCKTWAEGSPHSQKLYCDSQQLAPKHQSSLLAQTLWNPRAFKVVALTAQQETQLGDKEGQMGFLRLFPSDHLCNSYQLEFLTWPDGSPDIQKQDFMSVPQRWWRSFFAQPAHHFIPRQPSHPVLPGRNKRLYSFTCPEVLGTCTASALKARPALPTAVPAISSMEGRATGSQHISMHWLFTIRKVAKTGLSKPCWWKFASVNKSLKQKANEVFWKSLPTSDHTWAWPQTLQFRSGLC